MHTSVFFQADIIWNHWEKSIFGRVLQDEPSARVKEYPIENMASVLFLSLSCHKADQRKLYQNLNLIL